MATEVAQLLAVLTAALSADAATRVPAEETIQDASGRQGYLEALLQVIGGAAPTGATQLPLPPPWLLSARCAAYCRGASSRHAVTELFEPQCRPGRAAGWSARRTAPHVTGGGQGRRASEMRVSPPAVLLCRGLLALLCCARYSRVRMWMYVCVCESDSCACPHASR